VELRRVRQLLDAERRSVIPWGAEAELLPRVTRVRGLATVWHNIAFSALTSQDAEAEIRAQLAHYRALGCSAEWTVYAHDSPADLRHRLARHGFEIGPREAIMVLDTEQHPAWLATPSPHRIERLVKPDQLAQFASTAEEIFGGSRDLIVQELAAALDQGVDELVGYLGFDGERAVSVARLYVSPGSCFAGLYGGGTLEGHRGRGLYRAMVAARVTEAMRRGARYIRVDALPTSQPILERLGFRELTHAWPCLLRAD
jgi:GNAT superfamily N-acetyltransferase